MNATETVPFITPGPLVPAMAEIGPGGPTAERTRDAESVLKRLGYARVRPQHKGGTDAEVAFWVQEPGYPRRTAPVFVPPSESSALAERIDRWLELAPSARARRRAIFVAPSDSAAEEAWTRVARHGEATVGGAISILVLPKSEAGDGAGHFHLRRVLPGEVLRVATGVVVGLFRRSVGSDEAGQIDFEEMLTLLRTEFGLDVGRSLGVASDEDALFMLYHLAQRDSYAPGDGGANLHMLVLKPTGPAARLPWFAA